MDLPGMYMNAIYTMYDLCNMDQNAEVARRLWSLAQYDITIALETTEARFAVWGLQGTADADAIEARLRPLISYLTLGGQYQGQVTIIPGPQPQRSLLPTNDRGNASTVSVHSVNATLSLDRVIDLGGEMDIHQTYDGIDLDPQYVFSKCLRVMSFAARFGLNSQATEIVVDDGFVLTSEYDNTGRPLLRYRHVIKLMRVIANTMVRNNLFEEMDFELWKYGRRIAWGRLKAGANAATIGVKLNSTSLEIS